MTADVYIGTSSWADKSLIASEKFYPPDLKDTGERLTFFSRHFNLGEIDNTYYAFPSRKNTERWASAVPDQFRFTVKAFALFTQHPAQLSSIPKSFRDVLPPAAAKKARIYEKDVPEDILAEMWTVFLRGIAPLRESGKLGAILIDFPPWFIPSEPNRQYIARARSHIPNDQVVVEFRNPLWISNEDSLRTTTEFLRGIACGFVCVDEPQGLKESMPPVAVVTSKVAAVRFRGRNSRRWADRSAPISERLDWWYTSDELSEWLPKLEELRSNAEELLICFNTKKDDQSILNARKLQQLLDEYGT
jgi:uncharacterized protein YecE (DUF72 family)